jgi:hypothetical protein
VHLKFSRTSYNCEEVADIIVKINVAIGFLCQKLPIYLSKVLHKRIYEFKKEFQLMNIELIKKTIKRFHHQHRLYYERAYNIKRINLKTRTTLE